MLCSSSMRRCWLLKTITVDEAYVDKQLADIVINRDLTQFIL